MNWIRSKELQSFLLFKMRFRFIFVIAILVAVSFFVSATLVSGRTDRIGLSSEEAAWITAHPVILHAPDPDYAPFEFKDNTNHYVGMAPDFLKLVGKKLGLQFKEVPSPSWNASLDNIKRHKADLVTVATKTPERSEYMLFTSPYIEFRNVILMREDVSGNFKMVDLEGKTIAAIKGWAITTYIQKNFPDIKIHWVANVKAALKSVSSGTVDAVLLNRATAGYWRAKTDISNLRIAGETDYSYKLSFASRKDWPQLNRLLEKALSNISESERKEIDDKWILYFRQEWRPGPHFWIASAGAIVLLLILGIFTWIVSLRRQVQSRTVELEATNLRQKLAEEALRESEERFRLLSKASFEGIAITERGMILDANEQFADMFGYKLSELIDTEVLNLVAPESKDLVLQHISSGYEEPYDHFALKKDGSIFQIEVHGKTIPYEGRNVSVEAIRDITERMRVEEATRKVAALETANVVLENFVSDALGNQLNPIYGRVQLCGIRDNIDQIKSEIEIVEGGITKLLTGINAYSEFFRLGEHPPEKISSTDVSYILGPLLSGQPLKTYGNEKFPIDPGVKLRFVYDPKQEGALDWEGLPYVAGDESKIATAIQETLINAIESYDQGKGGDILVSAKKENNDLILEIADKGRGMSKEDRDKSQLPFFKVLGIKGSDRFGLGAYIARESAKYCGGDIHIESTKGVGTTASIILEVSG
ncbi:MAG: transporter substrate-binding domain-containing protein [Desulfobacterales bacterium]